MIAPAAFTVSGPGEQDHSVPTLGAGISCAQTFATRRRRDPGEFSYYVRDVDGAGRAIVTRTSSGVIETQLLREGVELLPVQPAPSEAAAVELEAIGARLHGLAPPAGVLFV